MITAIRPYTPQVRQNQPTFQAKLTPKEVEALVEGNDGLGNAVLTLARSGDYSGNDLAHNLGIVKKLQEEHKGNLFIDTLAGILAGGN